MEEKKEHKKSWQETNATEEDIQTFLSGIVMLRHNEVTGETEFRVLSISTLSAAKIKYLSGKTPLDEWRSHDRRWLSLS